MDRRRARQPTDAPELGEHHEGDFGVYMQHKRAKLHNQFIAEAVANNEASSAAAAPAPNAQLFAGVSVYINGLTSPPFEELRAMLGVRGGNVEYYLTKRGVTHIIAQSLPQAKIQEIRDMKKWMPVVTPSWVTSSIAAGKLQPVDSHLLPEFRAPVAGSLPHAFARTAGSDPLFLAGYLSSSRLHFIGSFRARVQTLVARWQNGVGVEAAPRAGPRVIAHVDIDCFFAQVALLERPDLNGTPVVVAHGGARPSGVGSHRAAFGDGVDTSAAVGKSPPRPAAAVARSGPAHALEMKDTEWRGGEISSANYDARAYGIYAGMSVGHAVTLCPHVTVLPYNFAKLEEVSERVFTACLRVTPRVQALSCDEAYLDLTGIPAPGDAMAQLREDILRDTRCTVSVGVGPNMLLARLATATAKPNGMLVIPDDRAKIMQFMGGLKASDLPDVGWGTSAKLEAAGITTVAQIQETPLTVLEGLIGHSKAQAIRQYARGQDDRTLQFRKIRKSIGAEVNWGVRFADTTQAHAFLRKLAAEVAARMAAASGEDAIIAGVASDRTWPPVRAHCITFHMLVRQAGAGGAWKHLGHGACDAFSRSHQVPVATADADAIADVILRLYDSYHPDATQVRGVGIHMSKLVHPFPLPDDAAAGTRSLMSFFSPSAAASSSHSSGASSAAVVAEDDDAAAAVAAEDAHERGDVVVLSQSAVEAAHEGNMQSNAPDADRDDAHDVIDLSTTQVSPVLTARVQAAHVDAATAAHLARAGVDVAVYASLPRALQEEVLRDARGSTVAPRAPSAVTTAGGRASVIAVLQHRVGASDASTRQTGGHRTIADMLAARAPTSPAVIDLLSQESTGATVASSPAAVKIAFEEEPIEAVVLQVRAWIIALGAHPHPQHARILVEYVSWMVKQGRAEDAALLIRAVARFCAEMREELADAMNAPAHPSLSDVLQAWALDAADGKPRATWIDALFSMREVYSTATAATYGIAMTA